MIILSILNFMLSFVWFCIIGSMATLVILFAAAFIRGEFKK